MKYTHFVDYSYKGSFDYAVIAATSRPFPYLKEVKHLIHIFKYRDDYTWYSMETGKPLPALEVHQLFSLYLAKEEMEND